MSNATETKKLSTLIDEGYEHVFATSGTYLGDSYIEGKLYGCPLGAAFYAVCGEEALEKLPLFARIEVIGRELEPVLGYNIRQQTVEVPPHIAEYFTTNTPTVAAMVVRLVDTRFISPVNMADHLRTYGL